MSVMADTRSRRWVRGRTTCSCPSYRFVRGSVSASRLRLHRDPLSGPDLRDATPTGPGFVPRGQDGLLATSRRARSAGSNDTRRESWTMSIAAGGEHGARQRRGDGAGHRSSEGQRTLLPPRWQMPRRSIGPVSSTWPRFVGSIHQRRSFRRAI